MKWTTRVYRAEKQITERARKPVQGQIFWLTKKKKNKPGRTCQGKGANERQKGEVNNKFTAKRTF